MKPKPNTAIVRVGKVKLNLKNFLVIKLSIRINKSVVSLLKKIIHKTQLIIKVILVNHEKIIIIQLL